MLPKGFSIDDDGDFYFLDEENKMFNDCSVEFDLISPFDNRMVLWEGENLCYLKDLYPLINSANPLEYIKQNARACYELIDDKNPVYQTIIKYGSHPAKCGNHRFMSADWCFLNYLSSGENTSQNQFDFELEKPGDNTIILWPNGKWEFLNNYSPREDCTKMFEYITQDDPRYYQLLEG